MSNALALRGLPASAAEALKKKWESRENLIARYRDDAKKTGIMATRAVVAGATGGAIGYMQGRYDRTEVAGMPLDATVALTAHALAFFFPEAETYLHASGDAAFAVYAYKEGIDIGRDRKSKAQGTASGGYHTF